MLLRLLLLQAQEHWPYLCFLLAFFAETAACRDLWRAGKKGEEEAGEEICGSPMESLIGLVNRIQRACTALGDHGGDNALPTLWEALPSVAVVGGQVALLLLLLLAQDFNFTLKFSQNLFQSFLA